MLAAYHRAAEPIRRRVLGQQLEEFSIGHAHLLAAIGSPLDPNAWAPDAQGLPELILATFLCSQPYARSKRSLRSRLFTARLWLWSRMCRRFDPIIERDVLRLHILEGTAVPEVWGSGGRELGAPTLLLLWQHLRWTRALHEDAVMNYPFAKAVWDYLAYHEQRGGVQICNTLEREIAAEIRQQKKEAAERRRQAEEGKTNAV
jgi:hypothetical protein